MSEMRRRTLFFIQNGVGGAERMTINIAKLLSSEKWDKILCKISIPCKIQNGKIDNFLPDKCKVTNIFWLGQLSFLKQIWKVLHVYKPDVVFSSLLPYNQRILLLAPFFPKIRFIVRNDNYLFTLNRIKKVTLKYTYRNASIIIAQTEEMKSELEAIGLNPAKIVVLHNFIDLDLIQKKANAPSPFPDINKVRFVSVGRLSYQKGFDILIKAFKLVSRYLPDAELYIVGNIDGDAAKTFKELNDLAESLEINDKVFFTGYTDNPYKYIKNASVYVLSSRYEGLPNVLVEAQFLQTPAAATKCIPIISRMIHDGVNGFLAVSEDSESLSQAMLNACRMNSIEPVYRSSSKEEFVNLFED